MARLTNGVRFSGTIGDLTYYQRWGNTYVRSKGSVTRERVLEGQEYATTRKYASNLAIASRIASPIYRNLPADRRARWVFRTITGDAASLLYKGMTEKEVKETLWKKYIEDTECNQNEIIPLVYNPYSSTKESNKKLQKLFLDRWMKQEKDLSIFKTVWRYPRLYDPETVKRIKDPFDWSGLI